MLQILVDVLDRLRFIPGLGWLEQVRLQVIDRQKEVEIKARKINNMKSLAEHNVKSIRELPSVIKGSKKRT